MNCRYKDIAGIPREGFHSSRFFGMALNDILGTILLAYISSWYCKSNDILNEVFKHFFYWFLLGQIFHWIFCVDSSFILWIKRLL